ncbi:MAG: aspartyl-trna synthetase [Maritimibacter sp.]|nr:aspartyl-trna synthetase [Maritimibacter sp.]
MAHRAGVYLGTMLTLIALGWLIAAAPAARAQDASPPADTAETADAETRGPVTNLPLPRFVSLKAGTANIRRGPSTTHRIDWVFTRAGMPLEVLGEYEHWRRVRDHDGFGGWIHFTLLTGARSGLVTTDLAPLYARPDTGAPMNAQLEANVIVALDKCARDWCRGKVGGARGWLRKADIWGVGADETFD